MSYQGNGTCLVDANGNELASSDLLSGIHQAGYGTSTNVLTSNGGTSYPTWQAAGGSGALTKIATVSASSSATVDFPNNISATYDNYLITIEGMYSATSSNFLSLRFGIGGTPSWVSINYGGSMTALKTASGAYTSFGIASGSTGIDLTDNAAGGLIQGNSQLTLNGFVYILGANLFGTSSFVTTVSKITYNGVDSVSGNYHLHTDASGFWGTGAGTAVTSVRFLLSAGTIFQGAFKLYGIQN